ncbi:MAG: SDR family oxidoreductase [bacterium]
MKKIYLILGASSDLGIALIRRICNTEDKKNIWIIAHYNNSCEELNIIKKDYSDIQINLLKSDLSNIEETKIFINKIYNMEAKPTHIVNFSAIPYRFNRLSEFDKNRIEKDMNIQVYSLALICQAFIPAMVENQFGKIVVMLSAATKGIPPKNTSEYTTVKYALMGLIKSLASDYGNYGININAVSPNMIETKFLRNISRKIKEYTAEKNPKHRNLKANDVIPLILFLLSDESQFMNGTNINLTGLPD